MSDDHHLLAQLRAGHRQAFEVIYERYRHRLLSLAGSLGPDAHMAEDIVHDVFASFYQNAHHLELHSSLRNYLYACTRNAVRDIYRRKALMQRHDDWHTIEVDHEEPAASACLMESGRMLRRCLTRLPMDQRNVVLWRAYQDLPFTEIACRQCICSSTARGRYRYGIGKLETLMRRAV